jgi:hypothetical protein
MKNKAWIIGVVSALVLSGCTSAGSNSLQPATEEATSSFESTGWECFPVDEYGLCATVTFNGASDVGLNDPPVDDVPFGYMMIICWNNSEESTVTVSSGSSWLNNSSSQYTWNPTTNPSLDYSIDEGARISTGYENTGPYGDVQPENIYLLRTWPTVMRDIASAKTLQIWLADSTGAERQVDINVEGSVAAVATLAGWGYGSGF